MSTVGLVIHLTIAMIVVLAVMWIAAQLLRRRAAPGRRAGRDETVEILGRRGLGRNMSVTVVRAAGRTLVLGVTEHQITLLGEAAPAPAPLDLTVPADGWVPGSAAIGPGPEVSTGPGTPSEAFTGAALGVGAGHRAVPARSTLLDVLRERTVRRV